MKPARRRQRKTDFVARVPRLLDLALGVELKATVVHDWRSADGERWAVVTFNDTPYLACAEDVK